jgi:hypothetical protein
MLFLAVISVAGADAYAVEIPELLDVPNTLSKPDQSRIQDQRQGLATRLGELEKNIAVFNGDCASVDKGSEAATNCRSRQGRLQSLLRAYITDAKKFNRRIAQLTMLTGLSDSELEKRIERSIQILRRMRSDFLRSKKDLKEWLYEAQDAEENALIESFKLLAGSALKVKNFDAAKLKKMKSLASKGLKILKYGEPIRKFEADPLDRQANLEMAHGYVKELHDILKENQDAYVDGKIILNRSKGFMKNADVTDVTRLASFFINYAYEASRWGVVRAQMRATINYLDRPNGKLDAQLEMKRVLEDLVREKKRRGGR